MEPDRVRPVFLRPCEPLMKTILKRVYHSLPFKREIFTLLRSVGKPPQRIYQHLHFKGIIPVKIDQQHQFRINHYGYQVENEIFWAGLTNGWEKVSIRLWIELCRKSEVIFDVGANTGIYSLIAQCMNPQSKVYAFEPVKRVFSKLEENIKLNEYKVTTVRKALSNYDGEAVIYDLPSEHIYSVTVNKSLLGPNNPGIETKIQTVTLNTFIRENHIGKIDLMKIDVETHEPEVLDGFSDYLNKFRPVLLIEILSDEVGERVEKMVDGLEYLYFNIDENSGIRRVTKITKSDYYNYLLCSQEIAKALSLIK